MEYLYKHNLKNIPEDCFVYKYFIVDSRLLFVGVQHRAGFTLNCVDGDEIGERLMESIDGKEFDYEVIECCSPIRKLSSCPTTISNNPVVDVIIETVSGDCSIKKKKQPSERVIKTRYTSENIQTLF